VVVSAGAARPHHWHRTVALGRGLGEAAAQLDGGAGLLHGAAPALDAGVAFVFSGQGGAYSGMARALSAQFPVVRATLEECDRYHRELAGTSMLPAMLAAAPGTRDGDRDPWPTELAQPALFAFQLAQCRLWESLGIRPRIVAGHSVGEYAALCAAGAMTAAAGMRLTVERGTLMRDATTEAAMIAIFADRASVEELLAAVPCLDLAAVNGQAHHVVAGAARAIREATCLLDSRGAQYVPLAVDRAFHSRLLDPMLGSWRARAAETDMSQLAIQFVGGPDGAVREPGWRPDADYLVRQTRQAVRFDLVLAELAGTGAIVEIGP
jgi:acyl transferase domain-containing protein